VQGKSPFWLVTKTSIWGFFESFFMKLDPDPELSQGREIMLHILYTLADESVHCLVRDMGHEEGADIVVELTGVLPHQDRQNRQVFPVPKHIIDFCLINNNFPVEKVHPSLSAIAYLLW
jgi:hypothetical protein